VRIELYADGTGGGDPVRQEMNAVQPPGGRLYRAAVPAARPPSDYTVRAVARGQGVAVPLEASRILWQR
jgi:starch phosphorylase